MTSRGRPRKFNVDRYANGRVKPESILPTPELLAKKHHLTGSGDPALSTNALGILRARGFITDDHLKAGDAFRRDLVLGYGSIGPASGGGKRGHDGADDEAQEKARKRAEKNVGDIRKACPSYNAYKRLRNLCAYYDVPPVALTSGDPADKNWRPNREQAETFELLEVAAAQYGLGEKRRAA